MQDIINFYLCPPKNTLGLSGVSLPSTIPVFVSFNPPVDFHLVSTHGQKSELHYMENYDYFCIYCFFKRE